MTRAMKDKLKELLASHSAEVRQFAGYVAVSGAALCVDFSIYWALLSVAHYAFIAAAGGYVCGVLSHYMMSSRVVFRDRFDKRGVVEEAPTVVKFFAAGASGLVVTAIVVGVLADMMGVHPLIAKICAAGCSFTVVFLSLRFFVFNHAPKNSTPDTAAAAA
ncbi:MAG: GtrA family protein [Hyphomicrobium sp.]|nr:GtrA family protein [Hyphomicrobium sp.]